MRLRKRKMTVGKIKQLTSPVNNFGWSRYYIILPTNSERGEEWVKFAKKVLEHIDNYTIPQYGDMPNDLASTMSVEQCVKSIEKYCKRFGKNQRPGQDKLDILKIAHWACIAYNKIGNK